MDAGAESTGWCSSTGSWPRSSILRHGVTLTACWPAGSEWTAPPSPGPSVEGAAPARRARVPSALAVAAAVSGRGHRPSRLERDDRHRRRYRDPGPPPGRRTQDRDAFISGKNKQNAVKSAESSRTAKATCSGAARRPASCADITQARQLGLVRLWPTRPAVEILADAGYQGLGRTGRWPGGDATAPQVQEERPGLVRGDARTPAQGTLLTPYPGRARHRPSEELAGPGPSSRPPRAHERHSSKPSLACCPTSRPWT
ncbi:hypothetical protein LV779_31830 [Streptomyces thinghirensis]|nr:hypothetical protein [Streptomyces thinghirensis]